MKAFAKDLYDHENALRDWLKSELDGKSDGAEKIFGYLDCHGISREDAVIPRKVREDWFSRSLTPRTPPTRRPRR